jgi:hypothetical protein
MGLEVVPGMVNCINMGNLFLVRIVIGLLALVIILSPTVGMAWDWGSVGLPDLQSSGRIAPFDGKSLLEVISAVINLAFAMAAIVAVIYLIIGGYSYVTAGGNPEAVEMAKTTIVNALIGLLVILVSYLIVGFVMNQLNADVELPNEGNEPIIHWNI